MSLAEQVAAAASDGLPAWVAPLVGLLGLAGGASWSRIQGGARTARKALATVETILDLVDGDEPPDERRKTYDAFLEAHGADTELLAALAARGFTPPQAAPTKPPEVKP